MTLLDEVFPQWDFNEVHEVRVAAPSPAVMEAARSVPAREVWALAPLMAVRLVPMAVRHPRQAGGRLRGVLAGRGSRPVIDEFLDFGFVELGAREGEELVLGAVGRFWRPTGNGPVALTGREAFLAFSEPGYAKGAMNFSVTAEGGGCRLRTETRVVATSPDARRSFGRYWRLILPGSALIRRSLLAAIRRRAEREAQRQAGSSR